MRNTMRLLISLCVGVTYGFSLPVGESKLDLTTKMPKQTNQDTTIKVNASTPEIERVNELPNNRSDIDESALYENANAKKNTQNERAFIYMNQRYKKPSLHHPGSEQSGPFSRRLILPSHISQSLRLNVPCKSQPAYVNSNFQDHFFPDRSPEVLTYFTPRHSYNVDDILKNYGYKENIYNHNNKLGTSHEKVPITSGQRDYIELLKTPLLRPLNRGITKVDNFPIPKFVPPYYKDFLKVHHHQTQYDTNPKPLTNDRKSEPRVNYAISPHYIQSNFRTKGVVTKIDDSNVENDLLIDNDMLHLFDKQNDDKLLDQYLKDNLQDQIPRKETPENECSYRDCILQSTKSSNSLAHKNNKEPDCKCGRHLNLNSQNTLTTKDRKGRLEKKCTKNKQKTPDVTYYGDTNENSKNITEEDNLNQILLLSNLYS